MGEPLRKPTVDTLRTVPLVHRFGDLFNPPGLTNFWGCAQVMLDLTGVRSISFPPFGLGELSIEPFGLSGDSATGVLYVDGVYFASRKAPVTFVWQPDRIERTATYDGLRLHSETILPFERTGVAVRLTVTNETDLRRRTEIKLAVRGGVTNTPGPWALPASPGEWDNAVTLDPEHGAVIFSSRHTEAHVAQGSFPHAYRVEPNWLVYELHLEPHTSWTTTFASVLALRPEDALREMQLVVKDFEGEAARCRERWNDELEAAFTPGNVRFSGHLPTLETDDPDLERLYHTSVATLLFHKRETPVSAYGRTYLTLAPRYWQTATFLWDISLSATTLAMLDPLAMRRMIETWMELDVHNCFGTDLLTGEGIGPWYSVNDYAMCRLAHEYLVWTGDREWLEAEVGGRNVRDRLVSYATHWRTLDTNGHGLADYGEVYNLLEAVGSYVHEVAGLNAANVWCLRFAADLTGDDALRDEAAALAAKVLELYVPEHGTFGCRLPDGTTHEVRHCYDFGTVLTTIPDDLTQRQRDEMVWFFATELQTPTWMRALSVRDVDVTFSTRPDHQWTGAYAAWPAICLNALFRAGHPENAVLWMRGLGVTCRQGPIAQACFAEDVFDPEPDAGALKAPSDQPWINDWSCVSGAAYLEPFVTGLLGVEATLDGRIDAHPVRPDVALRDLPYQGRLYDVTADGARPA